MDAVMDNPSRKICNKCEGIGWNSIFYAPNPKQKNVLRPQRETCNICKGMGSVFVLNQ